MEQVSWLFYSATGDKWGGLDEQAPRGALRLHARSMHLRQRIIPAPTALLLLSSMMMVGIGGCCCLPRIFDGTLQLIQKRINSRVN